MNKFISFINKTKNSQQTKKIRQFVFLHSLWFAVLFFIVGLSLDLIYGNTIFQRFGAILVGIAVLHLFENNYLEQKISRFTRMNARGDFDFLKDVPNLNREAQDKETEIRGVDALNMATQTVASRHSLPKSVATGIVLSNLLMRDENPNSIYKLNIITRNEWILAVAGTLIWAFGDWLTNYFYHCSGNLSCS